MKTWVTRVGHETLVRLNDKGIARELCRTFNAGVFWECSPDASWDTWCGGRPIFVGHASPSIQAAGTAIAYPPVTLKEDDILFAARIRKSPADGVRLLAERGVLVEVIPDSEKCPF